MHFKSKIVARYKILAGTDVLVSKMENIMDKPAFLKSWIDDGESSNGDNFISRINVQETDLEEMSDEEKEEHIKDAASDYLKDQWEDFVDNFEKTAEEENGMLVCYRCIGVEDEEEFAAAMKEGKYLKGFKGVGVWFSWNQEAAECHWGSGSTAVTVKALIPYSSIRVEQTLRANMSISTGEENEITVKKGAKIFVVEVLDHRDKSLLKPKKPIPLVA